MAKNPYFLKEELMHCIRNGFRYNVEEYYEKEIPVNITRKSSHIEYLINCDHCDGRGWRRRKDAKYCSDSCRKLANRDRSKKN